MTVVVGGTYHEVCRDPTWNELFGSGLRAAGVLASLGSEARLRTYISETFVATLEAYAATFGVSLDASTGAVTPRFKYIHALAEPWISPPRHTLAREEALAADADRILAFGMLECGIEVHGDYVVYDPQDAFQAEPFIGTGSSASHLAVIVNAREAKLLSVQLGMDDPADLRDALAAEVLIIKRGALGGLVYTDGPVKEYSSLKTSTVFPLGSGDVFAAGFAHHWMDRNQSPISAAESASQLAALWCAQPTIPLNHEAIGSLVGPPLNSTSEKIEEVKQVYLAAPFFTSADRWLVEEARSALQGQELRVFSPFHDVGGGPAEKVAPRDLAALEASTVVFAVVDRLDAGTLFEVGYARAREIPVVAFAQNEPDEPLKMLVGSGCKVVRDFSSAIYHTAWTALEE